MWQSKIYAFLIRRILGPYLTPESKARISNQSIYLSLREGTLSLSNIELDGEVITKKINSSLSSGSGDDQSECNTENNDGKNTICIKRIVVKTFNISLAFAYNSNENDDSNADCDNGDTNSSGRARLVTKINLDGVEVEIEPATHGNDLEEAVKQLSSSSSDKERNEEATSKSGMVQSYIQAALDSLQLSIDIQNISIRLSTKSSSTPADKSTTTWVSLYLDSLSYKDSSLPPPPPSSSFIQSKVILGKEICFDSIYIKVGQSSSTPNSIHHNTNTEEKEGENQFSNSNNHQSNILCNEREVIKMLGESTIITTIMSKSTLTANSLKQESETKNHKSNSSTMKIQRLIEIGLDQSLSIDLNTDVLKNIQQVAHDFTVAASSSSEYNNDSSKIIQNDVNMRGEDEEEEEVKGQDEGEDEDEQDISLLSSILKQQQIESSQYLSTIPKHRRNNNELNASTISEKRYNKYDGNKSSSDVFSSVDDPTATINDLFHSRSEGYSLYRSILAQRIQEETEKDNLNDDLSSDDNDDDLITTRICFYIKEALVNFHFSNDKSKFVPSSYSSHLGINDANNLESFQCVSLIIQDFNINTRTSKESKEIAMDVSDFSIQQSHPHCSTYHIDGIVEFLKSEKDVEIPVKSPDESDISSESEKVFTLKLNSKHQMGGQKKGTEVHVSLSPVVFTYRQNAISKLSNCFKEILSDKHNNSDKNTSLDVTSDGSKNEGNDFKTKSKIQLNLDCQHIAFHLPLRQEDESIDGLFRRCGYRFSNSYIIKSPTLSWMATALKTRMSQTSHGVDQKEVHISTSFQTSIISVLAPLSAVDSTEGMRFDFISFENETMIDPNAINKIEYNSTHLENKSDAFKKKRAKKYFPLVVPLASVKASQQIDDEDVNENLQPSFSNNGNSNFAQKLKGTKRNIRGSDPQVAMLQDAALCENNLCVHVPSIALDFTALEKEILINILSNSVPRNSDEGKEENAAEAVEEGVEERPDVKNTLTGLSFRCDQITLSMHDNYELKSCANSEVSMYTLFFVCDGFRSHCMLDKNGLKQIRLLSDDITMYEVNHASSILMRTQETKPTSTTSGSVRKRRFQMSTRKQSTAIFFRSKLSHPLSSKTPALLMDMIVQRPMDDDDEIERAVHISLYDMTYRYDLDSSWMERLKILTSSSNASEAERNADVVENSDNSIITNLFCTISDCNLDYTSPNYFKTASRTIIRVGELRMTSNLVFPSGPMQTYKLTIADVSLHLLNQRTGHHTENQRVSCSRIVFAPTETHSNNRRKAALMNSLEDALFQMNFISIATLDCLEATLTTSNVGDIQSIPSVDSFNSKTEYTADATAKLSLGKVNLNACKDSFACFISTLNELILKMTMPTAEEIDSMRKAYFNKQEEDSRVISVNKIQESSSSESHISAPKSPTLIDLMNRNLFSEDDSAADDELLFYSESNNDRIEGNRSRTSTMTTIPDSDMPISQRGEDLAPMGLGEAPNVIQNFYDVGARSVNPSRSHISAPHPNNDWTSVDHPWSNDPSIPEGEDQCAMWYALDDKNEAADNLDQIKPDTPNLLLPTNSTVIVQGDAGERRPRIFHRHVPFNPTSDPLAEGDMGATKYAGTRNLQVKLRLIVKDMSFNCRLFDGYDWPRCASSTSHLMSELLEGMTGSSTSSMFGESQPKVSPVASQYQRDKIRQTQTYFQFSCSGLKLRLDSIAQSQEHNLVSCMELNLCDMLLIETKSSDKPVKVFGEWINHEEYARDSNDGMFMLKMVTLRPETKFAADGKLMGDEAHVTIQFLPVRFFIHQSGLRFIRHFFSGDEEHASGQEGNVGTSPINHTEPPPDVFFPVFKVKAFDIKVDYKPLAVDKSALAHGNYVELLNLLPIEDMVLRLHGIEMRNLTGWGAIISELLCKWLEDVSSTQMHKFLTRTQAMQPITNVGDGMKQFVLIPFNEYKQKGNVPKAIIKGTTKLVSVVTFEALNVGARLTGFAAKKLKRKKKTNVVDQMTSMPQVVLPRTLTDASDRAIETLARGFKEANAKIVIMPYREFQRTGTKGAMKSVVRGIPVAVCAPLSGAAEALSNGFYGVSNQLRPDLYDERVAAKRFHEDPY